MELVLRDNEVQQLVLRNFRDEVLDITLGSRSELFLTLRDFFSDEELDLHRMLVTFFRGPHAKFHLVTRGVLTHSQQLTYTLYTRHSLDDTTSTHDIRYALDETSSLDFTGNIYVAPSVHAIRSSLTNKNLLLSQGPVVCSRPQLEVYSQDVDVSHGSATGFIDAEALFYLQQRGFPEALARRILVKAFLK